VRASNEPNFGLDYTPAFIIYSDNSVEKNSLDIAYKYIRVVSISLIFDVLGPNSDGKGEGRSEVRIAVKNGQLNKVSRPKFDYLDFIYTPIKEGELGQTIAEAIKNPMKW
jgi:hypothetical protein